MPTGPTDTEIISDFDDWDGPTIQEYNGTFKLPIPNQVMEVYGLDYGDHLSPVLENWSGTFTLSLEPADNGWKILDRAPGRYDCSVTVPRILVETARIDDQPSSIGITSDDVKVAIQHRPVHEQLVVQPATSTEITKQSSTQRYPYTVPSDTQSQLDIGKTVWFWMDLLEEGFVFIFDPLEDQARDFARSYQTLQQNGRTRVYIPKTIADLVSLNNETVSWGHDSDRLYGIYKPDS